MRGWILVWFVGFAALCMFRGNQMASPPYEDHALGIWNEAHFLATNDFDYIRLRYSEKNWMDGGGVRSYMISVLPTLLALLMSVSPEPLVTIVVAHVAVYACASLIFTLTIVVLRNRAGVLAATLASLAVVTTPLFLVQTQMIGMEIIMTAAGMTGFVFLTKGRPVLAAFFFLLAFFTKASGEVFTLAAIVYLFVDLLSTRPPMAIMSTRTCLLGLGVNVTSLVIEVAAGIWSDDPAILLKEFSWPAILKFPRVMLWAPEVAAIWILSALLALLALSRWLNRARGESRWSIATLRSLLGRLVAEEAHATFAFIFVSGMTAALGAYVVFPRYVAPAIPFVYILLVLSATTLSVPRMLLTTFLAVVLAGNLCNHDGKWYRPSNEVAADEFAYWTWWHPRMGVLTERSEEYFLDHFAVVQAIGLLQEQYATHPILAEGLYSSYLTQPAYGYVRNPFPHVFPLTSFPSALTDFIQTILPVVEGKSDNFPIFIWSGKSRTLIPPPGPYAEILFDDKHPILPLVVYRLKPEMLPKDRVALEEWYLDNSWGTDWKAMRMLERFSYLRDTGRKDRILACLKEAKESLPADDRLGFGNSLDEMQKAAQSLPNATTPKEPSAPRSEAAVKSPAYRLVARNGAVASYVPVEKEGTIRVAIEKTAPDLGLFTIQLFGPELPVHGGREYEVTVPVRSQAKRPILIALASKAPPYKNLGLFSSQTVTPEWQTLRIPFRALSDDSNAQVILNIGMNDASLEVGTIQVKERIP